jgi:hypothetical protein
MYKVPDLPELGVPVIAPVNESILTPIGHVEILLRVIT